MKKLIFTLTLAGALALGGTSAFAQAKKKKEGAAPAEAGAEKPKSAESGKPKAEGDTAKPKAEGDAAKPKGEGDAAKGKREANSFFGDVASVDSAAKTITLKAKDPTKGRVFKVTDATKIVKATGEAEAPAALSDVKADSYITGSYKKAADGSLEAVKVTLGKTKPAKTEGAAKKPEGEGKGDAKKPEGEAKKPAAEGKKPAAEKAK